MSTYCKDYKKDDCNKKKNCRAILECGKEFFRTLPTQLTTSDTPIPLAEVSIDTTKLYKPCVKIEYSSLINSVLSATTGGTATSSLTLTFKLIRQCKGEDAEDLRTWIYEKTTDPSTSLTSEDTFAVTFCECFDRACCDDPAGKCCTYTLQLVEVVATGSTVPTYTINEKDISAIAACPSCVY